MNLQILIWIFFAIFSLTAIITLLGITNVIKSIKEKYLNALFTALIIEVIGAVIGVFKGVDFSKEYELPDKIYSETHLTSTNDIHDDTHAIIVAINNSNKVDSLQRIIDKVQIELNNCKGSLSALDKDFYSYIIKLRNAMTKYPERSINIYYQPEKKKAEYELLKNIFLILDAFEQPNEINQEDILNEWIEFKARHGRIENNKYHILEYDITLLVREFLNKFYSVES